MHRNVHIVGTGSYHPKKVLDNNHFINHFKKFNLHDKAKVLMEKLGRNTRTLAENNENTITMAVEAGKVALDTAGLSANDLDMIIFASDTPEYLTPCCALIVRNKLKAENANGVFDVNCDCIGMLHGMDIASRFLKTDKKYKRVLVVGAMLISPFAREDDIIVYSTIADGAAAIILEVKEEKEERGFLGSRFLTDDKYNETIRFPACGLSNMSKEHVTPYDRKMQWNPFDVGFLSGSFSKLITELVADHNLVLDEVKHYFMSQFSIEALELTMEKLKTSMDKVTYIGDKYGYTGPTSPIMALNEKLKKTSFFQNEHIIFCSVAGGMSMSAILYKW